MTQQSEYNEPAAPPGAPPGAAPGAATGAAANDDAASATAEEQLRAAKERLDALEAEKESFRDRWMRAEAEIANVRARTKREVEDARLFAVQAFARDIVEVAENLRRGLESLPKAAGNEPEVVSRLREGFAGIERGFLTALERNGIRREDPTGAVFDPNRHQAMAEQPSAEHPPGIVLSAWTPAWTLNGRLIRPAMVVVSKGEPAELAPPSGAPGLDRSA
ncbi:MAG TPA: nucleotide exchange factor GrpE [Acetobacteraceae bacterium]|nr:nucleotide exchange factor GrpE [Acetobacteraceae bacterium]